MTESFNGWGTGITGDAKSLLFELLALLLQHRLSRGVFCEELDECWWTEDRWGGLMTELFNGGETDVTGDENLFLFEWQSLWLKHRFSREFICCLPWLFPFPLLWWQQIPFVHSMMNSIWVCGGVVCLIFCLLMAIKRWEPTFWRNNCNRVWVSVLGIKLITIFLSQYNPK